MPPFEILCQPLAVRSVQEHPPAILYVHLIHYHPNQPRRNNNSIYLDLPSMEKTVECSPRWRITWALIGGFPTRLSATFNLLHIVPRPGNPAKSPKPQNIHLCSSKSAHYERERDDLWSQKGAKSGETKPGKWMSGAYGIRNCVLNKRKSVGLKDGGFVEEYTLTHKHIQDDSRDTYKRFRGMRESRGCSDHDATGRICYFVWCHGRHCGFWIYRWVFPWPWIIIKSLNSHRNWLCWGIWYLYGWNQVHIQCDQCPAIWP